MTGLEILAGVVAAITPLLVQWVQEWSNRRTRVQGEIDRALLLGDYRSLSGYFERVYWRLKGTVGQRQPRDTSRD